MKTLIVLYSSLLFLRRQPLFFIPALVSTTITNAFFLFFLYQFGVGSFSTEPPTLDVALLYLIGSIVVGAISIALHGMYPTMVKDYLKTRKFGMKKSWNVSLNRLPRTFASVFIPVLIATVPLVFAMTIALLGYITGSLVLVILGVLTTAAIIIATAILFYFAPTSIIISNRTLSQAFRESFGLSKRYRRDVSLAVFVSFILYTLALFTTGTAQTASISLFLILRYSRSIVSAYLAVVNPTLYLGLKR